MKNVRLLKSVSWGRNKLIWHPLERENIFMLFHRKLHLEKKTSTLGSVIWIRNICYRGTIHLCCLKYIKIFNSLWPIENVVGKIAAILSRPPLVNRSQGVNSAKAISRISMLPMMASSNESIFRVTDHSCGEFTCHRWIPRTFCRPRLWPKQGWVKDMDK